MNLHENKSLFQDAIIATSQSLNIREVYIEKDYWVTVALYQIFHSEMAGEAIFKGGTALSKCHKLIERFSEDIDLVVLRNKGENDNQLKKKIKRICEIVGDIMPEVEIAGLTNKKGNIRKTVHPYEKIYKGNNENVREQIIVEATWLGNFEPNTTEIVSCYIADMMNKNGQYDLIEEFNLQPFMVHVLSKERTLSEKIMSLVRFSRQGNVYVDLSNKIRHIYDIHMMLKNEEIRNFFESNLFDVMINNVGQDDVISYKNNNEWLKEHPVKAIIFDQIDQTWANIRTSYLTNFKELVTGEFPNEEELIATLNSVKNRLQSVDWKIKVD